MITRRTALRLAASLPVAAPTIARADALAALDAPAGSGMPFDGRARYAGNEIATDPRVFAQEVVRSLWTDDALSEVAEELAAYKQALAAVMARHAETQANRHPIHAMDEAVFGLYSSAYLEGIRAGALAEQFRQAIIGPRTPCPSCQGDGIKDGAGCPVCQGHGTVLR